MAKMSLLDIVQDIMSDMNSDEINSINDSVEALQVAQIVKSSYYNIVDGKDFPWFKELFQMSSSGTLNRPTHLTLPENVIDLDWIKYNCKKQSETRNRYKTILYKTPEEFFNIVNERVSTDSNIQIVSDPTGIQLNIITNQAPSYFTSF